MRDADIETILTDAINTVQAEIISNGDKLDVEAWAEVRSFIIAALKNRHSATASDGPACERCGSVLVCPNWKECLDGNG